MQAYYVDISTPYLKWRNTRRKTSSSVKIVIVQNIYFFPLLK